MYKRQVIKALINQIHSGIEIVNCPILREPDGLAMSSRNMLLNDEERKVAALVPKIMQEAKQIAVSKGIKEAKQFINSEVAKVGIMKLDYFEVCNAENLQLINELTSAKTAIALIAVFVGKIRLIDNLIIN